ncbi:MAG: methylmalonyl-CoA mutase family protein [Balneolaceae bacterium]
MSFPPVSTQEWEQVLANDLNGKEYKELLSWHSLEDFDLLPFYRLDDLRSLPHMQRSEPVKTPGTWTLMEQISEPDLSDAAAHVERAIRGGTNILFIETRTKIDSSSSQTPPSGVPIQAPDDLKTLLQHADIESLSLAFSHPAYTDMLASVRPELIQNTELLYDPLTLNVRDGYLSSAAKRNQQTDSLLDSDLQHVVCADGSFYYNCGASIVQQLGVTIALSAEYIALCAPDKREQMATKLALRLTPGSFYFPGIALFRASRLLWERLMVGFGLPPGLPARLHAASSRWNKSHLDPHNNYLRLTTELAAAAVGGADTLQPIPFGLSQTDSEQAPERISRNISHILRDESHLHRVQNPADGAYYVEVLTDQLAKKAWHLFQRIEKAGGFSACVRDGWLQNEILQKQQEKQDAVNTRRWTLVGVNHYPNSNSELTLPGTEPNNRSPHAPAKPAAEEAISKGSRASGDDSGETIRPLSPKRAAEPFEEIRARVAALEARRGKPVTVMLIPVGDRKMSAIRTTFSRAFLGCAGFHFNESDHVTADEAAGWKPEQPADFYVLCGADDDYPSFVPTISARLPQGRGLIVAGNPARLSSTLQADAFMYQGCPMIELFHHLLEQLSTDES